MITSSWRPRRAIQRPMIVSDSPPWCPVTHREYESAVSMRLKPAPTNASSKSNEVASSAVHPKTFPPKASGAISNPVFPSLRLFMVSTNLFAILRRTVVIHRPAHTHDLTIARISVAAVDLARPAALVDRHGLCLPHRKQRLECHGRQRREQL